MERPGASRKLELFACAILLALSAAFVADHDAWTPDEPRVVALARSVREGSLVVPLLDGEPFLEQPPFHAWTVAGAYHLMGTAVAPARGVSAIAGALTLLLAFVYGNRLHLRTFETKLFSYSGITGLFANGQITW